jgi:hypothetical protein
MQKFFLGVILLQLPTKHRPKSTHPNNEWAFIVNYIFSSSTIKKFFFLDGKNSFQNHIMKKWPELYNFGVFAAWVHPVAEQHDNNFFFRVYP